MKNIYIRGKRLYQDQSRLKMTYVHFYQCTFISVIRNICKKFQKTYLLVKNSSLIFFNTSNTNALFFKIINTLFKSSFSSVQFFDNIFVR